MINVRCEIETRAQVMQSVQAAIPGARLREQRPRQLIWHVKPNTLPISVLFSKMEEARTTSNMVFNIFLFIFRYIALHINFKTLSGGLLHHADDVGRRLCEIRTSPARSVRGGL